MDNIIWARSRSVVFIDESQHVENICVFSRESNSTIANVCPSARPSVWKQNPSTTWNHHPSSFIFHPSSFFIYPSSFLHFATFKLFSLLGYIEILDSETFTFFANLFEYIRIFLGIRIIFEYFLDKQIIFYIRFVQFSSDK